MENRVLQDPGSPIVPDNDTDYCKQAAEPNEQTPAQQEARATVRRRMFKKAEIEIMGNFGNIPCIVRNSSTSGALIEIDGNFIVPEHFSLIVPMDGTIVECEMVRQHHMKVGLRYTNEIRVFRVPEKQAIQDSNDEHFKNFTRIDNYYVNPPSDTELAIRRHGNSSRKKPGFGNR